MEEQTYKIMLINKVNIYEHQTRLTPDKRHIC